MIRDLSRYNVKYFKNNIYINKPNAIENTRTDKDKK